jgi:hypothetical protein
VTRAAWQEVVRGVAAACETAGFDLVHPFNLADCAVTELNELASRPGRLGILIGNTRRLWPRFMAAVRAEPELARAEHPLDRYVTERLSLVATRHHLRVIFGHVTEPAAFPIQRLAEQTGFASLSPSHLAVHPQHGPWFGLRAVLLGEMEGPPPGPRVAGPCAGCSAPCVPALERALAVSGSPLGSAAIAAHTREWIAVRDACPVGRASRYSDAQLDYHYAPAARKLIQGS